MTEQTAESMEQSATMAPQRTRDYGVERGAAGGCAAADLYGTTTRPTPMEPEGCWKRWLPYFGKVFRECGEPETTSFGWEAETGGG